MEESEKIYWVFFYFIVLIDIYYVLVVVVLRWNCFGWKLFLNNSCGKLVINVIVLNCCGIIEMNLFFLLW